MNKNEQVICPCCGAIMKLYKKDEFIHATLLKPNTDCFYGCTRCELACRNV